MSRCVAERKYTQEQARKELQQVFIPECNDDGTYSQVTDPAGPSAPELWAAGRGGAAVGGAGRRGRGRGKASPAGRKRGVPQAAVMSGCGADVPPPVAQGSCRCYGVPTGPV